MVQVFRDCYRAEKNANRPIGVSRLWLHTLIDLVRTAPKEHMERIGKDGSVMKNLRRDALALLGCIAIIVIAFLLLTYGRKHEVAPILLAGRSLDALVTAGIVGNLIVFLLVKVTRINPVRIALLVFLGVNAGLCLMTILIGSRVDPQFRLGATLIGYFVSFVFWFGLHWVWGKSKDTGALATSNN